MTQAYSPNPLSPAQAAHNRRPLDDLLDPATLRALAEPSRTRLLSCLLKCGRACSVTEVAECCDTDLSTVSRHLATMARAGLLTSEKRGRHVWYRADADALAERCREIARAIDTIHHPDPQGHAMNAQDPSCCSPGCCNTPSDQPVADAHALRDTVRTGYAEIATSGQWSSVDANARPASGCCTPASAQNAGGGGCCGPTTLTPDDVAKAVGYSDDDLADIPEGANLGLSCGNPTALAALNPGETVLDLGAGAGFDCFIAGPRVGAEGRVIGVDMTPEMITKARANTAAYRERSGLDNVEFRLGEIENLPVADATVDTVISNCVINLAPDKQRVWDEIARVLKPGGRVAVSDLALLQPLPASVVADVEALVGCVAGAVLVDEVRAAAEHAGLTDIELTPSAGYIEAMTNWEDPLYKKIAESLPEGAAMHDYVVSLGVEARRPA